MRPHIIAVTAAIAAGIILAFAGAKYRVWKYQPPSAITDPGIQWASNTFADSSWVVVSNTFYKVVSDGPTNRLVLMSHDEVLDWANAHRTNRTMPGVRTSEPNTNRFPILEP